VHGGAAPPTSTILTTTNMGHEKAIKSGQEHRKPYRGAASWVSSCRNHGRCSYCESNRTQAAQKFKAATTDEMIYDEMAPWYCDDSAEEIREELCPDPTAPWNINK
jgi:hypothetical protein